MHQHVQEQAGTPPLEPSSRGAVWGIYRYFCFLLLKTLPSIIFSFLTSWGERKSRNGCTLDVPRGKWFAGVMPGLERRKQQHHRHTHKVRVCELWLGGAEGGLLPSSLPEFLIWNQSLWEHCSENEWNAACKALGRGLTHTFNRGSNYCYCFTIINKGNSCKK